MFAYHRNLLLIICLPLTKRFLQPLDMLNTCLILFLEMNDVIFIDSLLFTELNRKLFDILNTVWEQRNQIWGGWMGDGTKLDWWKASSCSRSSLISELWTFSSWMYFDFNSSVSLTFRIIAFYSSSFSEITFLSYSSWTRILYLNCSIYVM